MMNFHVFRPATVKTDADRDAAKKSEYAATRTITLRGDGGPYTATMTFGPQGLACEWEPHTPIKNGRGLLKKGELKRYQRARNELAQAVADHIGGAVLVVD
jgi:hypothetical protein